MNEITFYYGMSGTFKATLIKKNLEDNKDLIPVFSMIKPWKYYEDFLFSNKISKNDLNFAILHLCQLKSFLNLNKDKNILVERGVSDMLFYNNKNCSKINELTKYEFEKCIKEEENICIKEGKINIKKILLIQNDIDFIENVILKEKTRSDQFIGGVNEYLFEQDNYIKFTKKYNNINEIKVINSAKDFLEKNNIKFLI